MSTKEDIKKKEFQFERIILFSDAVFAIAITLLIIEIKIPHLKVVTDQNIGSALIHMIPKFIGFILSFFVIGIYWTVHHKIFGYIDKFDSKLIWLNILFLFSIVLMPFSNAIYSEYWQPNVMIPLIFYTFNLTLTGIFNFLLIRHIAKLGRSSHTVAEQYQIKLHYARAIMIPAVFITGIIISLLTLPFVGRMAPVLIPLYLAIIKRMYKAPAQKGKS